MVEWSCEKKETEQLSGFWHIVCYFDSFMAVKLVRGILTVNLLANDIFMIRSFFSRDWSYTIRHSLRKGNHCANFLAKQGVATNERLTVIQWPTSGTLFVATSWSLWSLVNETVVGCYLSSFRFFFPFL